MKKIEELEQSIEQIAGENTPRKEPPIQKENSTGQPIPPTEINNQPSEFFSGEQKTENKSVDQEKKIQESGKANAYLAGGAIETVFGLLERVIYLNKFSADEKEVIINIQEKDEKDYSEYEQKVNRKFLAVTKRHDRIRDRIPLDKKEEEALETAFIQHARVTGKLTNSNLIIWATIAKVFTQRSIDIFLD